MNYSECIGTTTIEIAGEHYQPSNNGHCTSTGRITSVGSVESCGDSLAKKKAVLTLFRKLVEEKEEGEKFKGSRENSSEQVNDENSSSSVKTSAKTNEKTNEKGDGSTGKTANIHQMDQMDQMDEADDEEKISRATSDSDSDTKAKALYVVVSDGLDTYHGRIPVNSVKLSTLPDCNKKKKKVKRLSKFEQISNVLLQQPHEQQGFSGFSVTFMFSSTSPTGTNNHGNLHYPFVKIVIKQAVRNIVKISYTGELLPFKQLQNSHATTINTTHANGLLTLLQSLSRSFNQCQQRLHSTQQLQQQTTLQLHAWKDTATKLEQSWQDEKDETLHNYLILLNRVKADLRSTKEELSRQKQLNQVLKQNAKHRGPNNISSRTTSIASSSSSSLLQNTSAKRRTPLGDNGGVLFDYEDEHDCAHFEEHEIDALAAGKRVKTTPSNKNSTNNLVVSTSSSTTQTDEKKPAKDEFCRQSSISSHQSTITAATHVTSSQTLVPQQSTHVNESQIPTLANPYNNELWIFPKDDNFKNHASQLSSLISSSPRKSQTSSSQMTTSLTSPPSASSSTTTTNGTSPSPMPSKQRGATKSISSSSTYLSSPLSSSLRKKRKAQNDDGNNRGDRVNRHLGSQIIAESDHSNVDHDNHNDKKDYPINGSRKKKRVRIKET